MRWSQKLAAARCLNFHCLRQNCFQKADSNEDGFLDETEVITVVQKLADSDKEETPEDASATALGLSLVVPPLIKAIDADKDGKVSLPGKPVGVLYERNSSSSRASKHFVDMRLYC